MTGIETHHLAVANDAHQAVGRQQDAGLGQANAKSLGLHGQQQVKQYVAGQAQGHGQCGAARGLVTGSDEGSRHKCVSSWTQTI